MIFKERDKINNHILATNSERLLCSLSVRFFINELFYEQLLCFLLLVEKNFILNFSCEKCLVLLTLQKFWPGVHQQQISPDGTMGEGVEKLLPLDTFSTIFFSLLKQTATNLSQKISSLQLQPLQIINTLNGFIQADHQLNASIEIWNNRRKHRPQTSQISAVCWGGGGGGGIL